MHWTVWVKPQWESSRELITTSSLCSLLTLLATKTFQGNDTTNLNSASLLSNATVEVSFIRQSHANINITAIMLTNYDLSTLNFSRMFSMQNNLFPNIVWHEHVSQNSYVKNCKAKTINTYWVPWINIANHMVLDYALISYKKNMTNYLFPTNLSWMFWAWFSSCWRTVFPANVYLYWDKNNQNLSSFL